MRRKVPSLNALLIFESAARLQSFTQAADELALTQSAVCKQIANLEEWLGLALFSRIKKRVVLTAAGRDYAGKIRIHLDKIERDTLELMGHKEGSDILELAVIPTFATQWLIPKLQEFQSLHPDITINLSTKTSAFLFSECLFHAAIHSGKAPWPGTVGDYLIPEDNAIPVCSPTLYKQFLGKRRHLQFDDIAGMPLLHLSSRLEDWRRWFELHDHPNDISAVKGARYELFTMLLEACIAGLGVALIPRYMAQKEIDAGKLMIPMDRSLPEQASYFLVYPEEQSNYGPLQAFRSWLLEKTSQQLTNG
ncbi:LysR family transcriptional regulator [Undibacterium sp. LX40W]|uniref:LysR family transcriptional regulator n=1 Tax=Undibacterium nitidum TaxID=2762298 RepID=A0A923KPU0_9BURK|nr:MULTISPECIES: LysR substrate-binding domain-containing protein [Undibacterium]MBC3882183.1 LysR family transcriptional regulator [Undibacterium nitidum]MBC3892464.1 LysR family transcriptional regulator [Undibacterium sp. LX40W]